MNRVVFCVCAAVLLIVVSSPATAFSAQELSGSGGIGNTRDDILGHWQVGPGDLAGEQVEDGFHHVTYDLPDYQISFMFQLDADEKPRPTDRAVDIIISWMSYTTRSDAERQVDGWLPDDADEVGRPEGTATGEEIVRYQSDAVADVMPEIDHPGFDQPGGLWVTYWPAESSVGVVEISLFHPHGD